MRLVTSLRIRLLAALGVAVLNVGAARADPAPAPRPKAMVAAANPAAVEAGLAVLRRGGSAIDAAVAVQAQIEVNFRLL